MCRRTICSSTTRKARASLAFLLSRMRQPDFPEPLGIFRDVEQERYVQVVRKQTEQAMASQGAGDIRALIDGGETWTVS